MKNEKLKEIIEELQTILDGKMQEEIMRLISCIGRLKEEYPKYAKEADETLDIIKDYVNNKVSINVIKSSINQLIEDLNTEDVSILEALKETYEDAKDIISEAIPEDVKAKCGKVITTTGNIGRGFADTINKEIPQIPQGIEKIKATPNKVKNGIKSKLRDVLFSDEEKQD